MNRTADHYAKAKRLIPGGTQLLSKRPEMFLPGRWPSHFSRAAGVEVWDLDGRKFVDMTLAGIGACPLGFADPDVNAAVKAAIEAGSMCTLNCPDEVELAELLCELHPWAEMARFCRSGGEAMAIAVRIARAATARAKIAFSGYHGWHDWYLAANLADDANLNGHLMPGLDPAGVPQSLAGTAIPFAFNDRDAFDELIAAHGHTLAAIVMEPMRSVEPKPGFLDHVRATADRVGAVLIFDEITAGWRMNVGGSHLRFRVVPDLAVFAKAISNGFPMAAIIGCSAVMQAAQSTFISSTYWTERTGPAAALATIRKMRECDVPAHLIAIGNRMRECWKQLGDHHGLALAISGAPPLSTFAFELGEQSQAAATLFTQIMLDHHILAGKAFYATFAHQTQHVESYRAAADLAFQAIAQKLETGDPIASALHGPVAHTGFRRLA